MTHFLISLLGPPSLSPSLYPHLISAIILIILLSISTADMTIPLKSTPPHSHCYQLSWHHPLCSHLIPCLSSLRYNIWRCTLISVAQILSSCLWVNGQISHPYINLGVIAVLNSKTLSLVGIFMSQSTFVNSPYISCLLWSSLPLLFHIFCLPYCSIIVPRYLNVDTFGRSVVPSLSYTFIDLL